MEHRFRRKWFENTTFCIAVVKLACTDFLAAYFLSQYFKIIIIIEYFLLG